MKSQGDYYDPDEDIRSSSPGLVPTKINYKPEESPPPYIPTSSSSSASLSPGPDESKGDRLNLDASTPSVKKSKHRKKRKKGRTRPFQGDAVLISYLDPNRPDIARQVAQQALNSASQSESGDGGEKDMSSGGGGGDDDDENGRTNDKRRDIPRAAELQNTACAALNDDAMKDSTPERPAASAQLARFRTGDCVMELGLIAEDVPKSTSLNGIQDSSVPSRTLYPPLPLKIMASSLAPKAEVEADSIITSPALAKFAISAAQANPESTLPAMQKSPPRSMSLHSPDGTQSLPSLQIALSQISDKPIVETPTGASPFSQSTGPSPTLNRPHYLAGNSGPSSSAYSNPSPASSKDMTSMSPRGYPNHSNFWRCAPKDGSLGTTSPASAPGVTPGTTYSTTPKDIFTSPENSTGTQLLNGPMAANGPFPTTTFKCTHPGCTAPPFQTQYLLTSHANVHSSSRPHYCPVKSCPRSIGGKGFKRKNEMIRHGLVHESPGYKCPFCAEQQHKYPRPDNLQR